MVTHWAAAWDDTVHNFLLYRFPAPPRKWIMLPWDFDVHIGGRDWPNGGPAGKANPPDVSFLLGKANEKGADVSRWKDSYYRVHEADYLTRLKELGATTLSPANVLQSVDEWGRAFSLKDFAADPTTKFCDPAANAESIKSWIVKRDAALKSRYP